MTRTEPRVSKETTFNKLIDRYDAFLLDIWGVIHDGLTAYPGAVECVKKLVQNNKQILLLSNVPRNRQIASKRLRQLGFTITAEQIITSGDMIRKELREFSAPFWQTLGKRCYHVGAERNQDLLDNIKIEVVDDLSNADFILLSAYIDPSEDKNQYDALFKKAVSLHIPILCANPDKEVVEGSMLRLCGGFLAEKFEQMGGKVYYYGKPHSAIYQEAFILLKEMGIQNKSRIIMIGDTLETDILGANQAGIDSALVLNGNTKRLLNQSNNSNRPRMDVLNELFVQYHATPTWVIPNFSL